MFSTIKKTVFIFIILGSFTSSFAATKSFFQYGSYPTGKIVPLFGDRVNVRSRASLRSRVVNRLGIGTQVKILENTKSPLTLKGYRENWYKVEYEYNDQLKRGFIWGGLLAKAALGNSSNMVLIGITRVKNKKIIAQARLIQSGQLVSKSDFPVINTDMGEKLKAYGYSMNISHLGNKGFGNGIQVIKVGFSYEACDYSNGDVLLFIKGNNIVYGLTAIWVSNEVGGMSFKYIFPDHPQGKKNTVTVIYTYSNNEDKNDKIEKKFYKWNGNKLVKVK